MRVPRYEARRYEGVLPEGRTHPLVLGCRPEETQDLPTPKIVKAIGCPEITATQQLVAEVVGNAVARRMGLITPEPCIVTVSPPMARAVTRSLQEEGFSFRPQAGYAAGCARLALTPYTKGQNLNPEQRTQAARLYVFDMLSQNSDRRAEKVNCAFGAGGLVAFDFEMCFLHLFVPIIGGRAGEPWEPSKCLRGRDHLFFATAKADPLPFEAVRMAVEALTPEWWAELVESLPEAWRSDAERIRNEVREISEHALEFARDIVVGLG